MLTFSSIPEAAAFYRSTDGPVSMRIGAGKFYTERTTSGVLLNCYIDQRTIKAVMGYARIGNGLYVKTGRRTR